MKYKKILGWLLLIAGIVIICWTLYSSYNIFTGNKKAPEIFSSSVPSLDYGATEDKSMSFTSEEEFQREMEEIIEKQVRELVPREFLSKILNLISWAVFAGILIFGASKISSIGIRLIRKE